MFLMRTYALGHLSDAALLRDLSSLVAQERNATAGVLAHVAEVDARKLYLPEGYPSMRAYCVERLRFSEDAAFKRIQAARAAREFPVIFEAVADGRLHLAAVCMLAPHLIRENADELIAAAMHRTKAEIEQLLAERFPRTELLPLVQGIPRSRGMAPTPGQVSTLAPRSAAADTDRLAPGQVQDLVQPSRAKPIAFDRVAIQFTMAKVTHEKLEYARSLLSHRFPSGDVAQVFDLALDVLVRQLEKGKFATTSTPRPQACRPTKDPRHIPAHVRLAVWERDQGRCTFVSASGHRCGSSKFLEYDHVDPVARGGRATVENTRLRCRGHNQHAAENMFGVGFMNEKRDESRRVAAQARKRIASAAEVAHIRSPIDEEPSAQARTAAARAPAETILEEHARDVEACLRNLGVRADQARRAVEVSMALPEATLEERVHAALRSLCPRVRSRSSP
jgi:hypothetical protein